MLVAVFADLSCVPVTYEAVCVIVSVSALPRVVLPVTVRSVKVPDPEMLATLIKSEPFQAQTAASP